MKNSPLSPSVLERALSKVLGQEFNAQEDDWIRQCKAALERIIDEPDLLMQLAEAIETIDPPRGKGGPSSALSLNLTLRELPNSGVVDAISEDWPTGSIQESPATVAEPQAAGVVPILPNDLKASLPVWLSRLLDANPGSVLAVDFRLPAALMAAGDGRDIPPLDIGEGDSIRVNITPKNMVIDPNRMSSTEPLWLSVAEIREEQLVVIDYWKFEQTVETYSWPNSFESGVLIVSSRPIEGG